MRGNNVQSILAVLAELLLKVSSLFFEVPCIKIHRNSHKISEWGTSVLSKIIGVPSTCKSQKL